MVGGEVLSDGCSLDADPRSGDGFHGGGSGFLCARKPQGNEGFVLLHTHHVNSPVLFEGSRTQLAFMLTLFFGLGQLPSSSLLGCLLLRCLLCANFAFGLLKALELRRGPKIALFVAPMMVHHVRFHGAIGLLLSL